MTEFKTFIKFDMKNFLTFMIFCVRQCDPVFIVPGIVLESYLKTYLVVNGNWDMYDLRATAIA
ncbi:hypothetical protein IFR05_002298, partial [Cadophora sp. M221]